MVVAAALFSACAMLGPPKPVALLNYPSSALDTAIFLDAQAQKCWTIKHHAFRSGVTVRSQRLLDDSAQIALYRILDSGGVVSRPFFVIEVYPSQKPEGARVVVMEGDFACAFDRCTPLGLAPQVEKWLAGNLECQPNPIPFGI